MPNFHRSELTDTLVRYLRELPKGTRVSYQELSRYIGMPVTPQSGHLIYARQLLERDHNQVWGAVKPKIGIFRLNDDEMASRQRQWYLNGARRKLNKGASEADCVETRELDIAAQARFSTDCIQRELVLQSLSRATRNRLEKVARGTSNDLPAFNAVEWAITLSPRGQR